MDRGLDFLSSLVIHNKYANFIPKECRRQSWKEIVGAYFDMHRKRFPQLDKELAEAEQAVLDLKVLPSMRGLQNAGPSIEKHEAKMFNCYFQHQSSMKAFADAMYLLLCGCGVGYSVQKRHVKKIAALMPLEPKQYRDTYMEIGDDIEGWADSILFQMTSACHGQVAHFDYSKIRAKNTLISSTGSRAPGPEPLRAAHVNIQNVLDQAYGRQLTPLEVHDIMCYLAEAVRSGGVRRSAMIALFDHDEDEMIECKSGAWYENNIQRAMANNSVVLHRTYTTKAQFDILWRKIKDSNAGEPGIAWTWDYDFGGNPCFEIALRHQGFCNLTEINAQVITTQQDLMDAVRIATFIGTLQASYTNFKYLDPGCRETAETDALVGVSFTGIAGSSLSNLDLTAAAQHAVDVNGVYARKIGISPAARVTTVKPAGTTSCVLGTSSGIHAWYSQYFIRRMRMKKSDPVVPYLDQLLGDKFIKPDVFDKDGIVIEIPCKAPEGALTNDVETAEQFLDRVLAFSRDWVQPGFRRGSNHNNVSATIQVKEHEWPALGYKMWTSRYEYSGLSVLPHDSGSYQQAPFEKISQEEYQAMIVDFPTDVDFQMVVELENHHDLTQESACTGGACEITSI